MRIIIVGAGAVGYHLAERLALEGQDIVVIEADAEKAAELQSSVDCLVIHGNGASRRVLEEAGIESTGLLIAVTSSDAVNILACQAAAGYQVPRKIARVEDETLLTGHGLEGVDLVIDPSATLARDLVQLVHKGGVSEIVEFADGGLVLLGGHVQPEAPLAGMTLAELRDRVTGWEWIVTAVVRNGETVIARGDTEILVGDHVMVMCTGTHQTEALGLMGLEAHEPGKVMVLGGTRLADLTSRLLAEEGIHTVLIDQDVDRCRSMASESSRLVVVCGDPTDPRVLAAEGIDAVDTVLALSGWDEVNIVGCLVAKALGVAMTVARFHRFEFVGLLAGVGVDAGVSSRLAAANEILRFVRRGRIRSVTTFQDSSAEAIEIEVGGASEAAGRSLREVNLPRSAIVGGIIRDGEAFIPHGDTVVQPADDLILVALPDAIPAVERVFG
ncbi:MAG: Trk system potassium transporter TrkA [Actinobacteria bacterium]|nr:Trk system potassium transporter TrkA [Actinomycetota bacterium]MBU1492890.1 Trk system potassium transporter TrkA [Actinomycetota bacterium]